MRRRLVAYTALVLITGMVHLGCGYRPPVPGVDPVTTDLGLDGAIPCPLPHRPAKLISTPTFALAITADTQARLLGNDVAILSRDEVRALVFTRPAAAVDPLLEIQRWKTSVERGLPLGGALAARSSGTRGKSAEGDPDVKQVLWAVTWPKPATVGAIRNWLLDRIAEAPRSSGASADGPQATAFIIQLTVVSREAQAQLVVTAAVARRDAYDQQGSVIAPLVDDLGNGSAVSAADRVLDADCHLKTVGTGQKKADILWVIDESGSTNDNRKAIIANAERFFAKALAAGLDFRMGVTGMVDPPKTLGKLCSRISSDVADEGGVDRFLTAAEKDIFSACVENPPFRVSSREYGLAAIYHGVQRHLPRADRKDRFRPGASIVVIAVTDEAPQELKTSGVYNGKIGFLTSNEYKSSTCVLPPDKKSQLDDYLAPWKQLLSSPDVKAKLHLIGGSCASTCRAEIPYGYKELVHHLGGQTADICQDDLGPTLQVIIDSIAAGASPGRLSARPISSTLKVELDGSRLARSSGHQPGYSYSAVENALTFYNVKVGLGTRIVASYHRFVARQ
jgi:hypothetical protein